MNPALPKANLPNSIIRKGGVKFADLHLHTIFSDGTYQPQELVEQARRSGLSSISVVDHDTVEGISPTLAAGRQVALEVIPGIELSADYNDTEVHILGYCIDYQNKELLERLSLLKDNRIQRIYKMVEKLKNLGVQIEADEVFNISAKGIVGRLHIARALLKAGAVKSTAEAFRRYIGDKGPAYYCGFKLNPAEAINLIRKAGGIPVLAHPYTLSDDELVLEFIKEGIMGLEVYYPEHTQSMINFYLELAQKYNLLITGGSDCHGSAKPEARIGSLKIPYELVEKLKSAKEKIAC